MGPVGPIFFCAKKIEPVLTQYAGIVLAPKWVPCSANLIRVKKYREVLIDSPW
jgi:hypothetical protein